VVFGLGIATVLTLVLTPALLALRVWTRAGAYRLGAGISALALGSDSRPARDLALARAARRVKAPEILWGTDLPAFSGPERRAAPLVLGPPVAASAPETMTGISDVPAAETADDAELPPMTRPNTALLDRARRLATTREADGAEAEEAEAGSAQEAGGPPLRAAE
jgi:hypothetical protein